jgi:hypothetical protein
MSLATRWCLFISLGSSLFFAGNLYAADAKKNVVSQPVPFEIEAREDVSARFPGAPRLQSFAWAEWEGKWIFIAGRSGGYHGVGGAEADFPRAGANAKIWVVDPTGPGPARSFSFPLAALPATLDAVKDQWMSSNLLFVQDRGTLYLAGGYGQNARGEWVTYSLLSSVNLPALVEGVMRGRDTFSQSIAYTESPLVQSTGGELIHLDDGMFYIVGGHVFTGSYRDFEAASEKNSAKVSQTYLGEIRKLSIQHDEAGHLAVKLVERYQDPEFNRRDFTAALTILPDGHSLGAAVYGGVFTKDQLNFTKPIYWNNTTAPRVDTDFDQKMSAYTCANFGLFDPASRMMYTTFLGGISRWIWNYDKKALEPAPLVGDKTTPVYLDGMQWTDNITTLVRGPHETFEAVQPANRIAAYLGSNAAFLPAPGLRRIREDAAVFDMGAMRGQRVLVGYLYGGVRAYPREFPYRDDSHPYNAGSVPTKTSDMIVAVYITVPSGN